MGKSGQLSGEEALLLSCKAMVKAKASYLQTIQPNTCILSLFIHHLSLQQLPHCMFDLYFKDNFVAIYYNKELRLGKAIWNGQLSGAEFREATLLCLDLIDRYELSGWLGDDRNMQSILPADLQWSLEVFVPRIVAGSVLRLALLPSVFKENQQAMEVMHEKRNKLGQQLVIREFAHEQDALAWLLEPVATQHT